MLASVDLVKQQNLRNPWNLAGQSQVAGSG
jgi:hypothetical protein